MRGIVHLLTKSLLDTDLPLTELEPRKDIVGLGMSDWRPYADRLSEIFTYTNTFYDHEPMVDITDPAPSLFGTHDFLISTDVFEHVCPPVSRAFVGAKKLLKPGGLFVFSVPYRPEGDTLEHFPELHDFEIVTERGEKMLKNTTSDGRTQRFDKLVFHGGGGATLEMRVFSRRAIEQHLADAGFKDIQFLQGDYAPSGVIFQETWSLPLVARA